MARLLAMPELELRLNLGSGFMVRIKGCYLVKTKSVLGLCSGFQAKFKVCILDKDRPFVCISGSVFQVK